MTTTTTGEAPPAPAKVKIEELVDGYCVCPKCGQGTAWVQRGRNWSGPKVCLAFCGRCGNNPWPVHQLVTPAPAPDPATSRAQTCPSSV